LAALQERATPGLPNAQNLSEDAEYVEDFVTVSHADAAWQHCAAGLLCNCSNCPILVSTATGPPEQFRQNARKTKDEADMAYANSSRVVSVSLTDRLVAVVSVMRAALQRRRVYEQTLRELRDLSDRDLADLGIHRSLIPTVAKEAAYGK